MNLVLLFVATLLFVVLSPGVFVTLPSRGSRKMVLLVHALIFFAILFFFGHMLKNMITQITGIEGFAENATAKKGSVYSGDKATAELKKLGK
jgi:hypothetical protein